MRDAVGRFRWLDKKLAHAPNVIAGHVVSFGAHQFCGVNIHTFSLLRWRRSCSSVLPANSSRQQKTRAPNNLGGGQVPHTNGLTVSRQWTLPTRPRAPWLAPRATSSGPPAGPPISRRSAARTNLGQVRVRCPHSSRGDSLHHVTNLQSQLH